MLSYYDGYIDEFRVYKRVLSSNEVYLVYSVASTLLESVYCANCKGDRGTGVGSVAAPTCSC